ncbi:MAG: hypothetical protein ABDH37_01125 [Candidatus Hydrothermales bacterium]
MVKRKKYHRENYDFMDNLFNFTLKLGKKRAEDIKNEIINNLEKEKNNPSFLHATYLTSNWVLKDSILMKEILKNVENLKEDKYKIAIKINYLLKNNPDELLSYLKTKNLIH